MMVESQANYKLPKFRWQLFQYLENQGCLDSQKIWFEKKRTLNTTPEQTGRPYCNKNHNPILAHKLAGMSFFFSNTHILMWQSDWLSITALLPGVFQNTYVSLTVIIMHGAASMLGCPGEAWDCTDNEREKRHSLLWVRTPRNRMEAFTCGWESTWISAAFSL